MIFEAKSVRLSCCLKMYLKKNLSIKKWNLGSSSIFSHSPFIECILPTRCCKRNMLMFPDTNLNKWFWQVKAHFQVEEASLETNFFKADSIKHNSTCHS